MGTIKFVLTVYTITLNDDEATGYLRVFRIIISIFLLSCVYVINIEKIILY